MKCLLCLFFFVSSLGFSQSSINAIFIDSLTIKETEFIGFDAYKDHYYITNNVFHKQTNQQNLVYKNVALGKITKIDILNPLQLVLLYKDFNAVVLLDNQLNETNRILGNTIETPISFEFTGLASSNQFWFFDVFSQKIGLYQFKNNSLRFISTPLVAIPKVHQNNYNHYLWIDTYNDFFSINLFGKIQKIGKIPEADVIKIIDSERLLLKIGQSLYYYNLTDYSSKKIELNENSFVNFFFKDGILSIFTQNKITNYKIILP
jgi:hypothetical protein